MTNEQALQIVEKASETHEGVAVNRDLASMIYSITDCRFDGEELYWVSYCEGTGTDDYVGTEKVAEWLAHRINQMENLLFAVGR